MGFPTLALLIASLTAVAPSLAADTAAPVEQLRVGKTNIFCVMEPCPWRGIARADNLPKGPADLLWSGQVLPPLDATDDDAERIIDAWNSDGCLLIEGLLTDDRLRVEQIVGGCP